MNTSSVDAGSSAFTASLGRIAWAPLFYSHEPNPPINLENGPSPYVSQEVIIRDRPGLRLTWLQNLLQTTLKPEEESLPPAGIFFNPTISARGTLTWLNDNQSNTLAPIPDPFIPASFPNPSLKSFRDATHVVNLLQTTLKPEEEVVPFNAGEWTVPSRKGGLIVDISSIIAPEVPVKPQVQVSWPNPASKERLRQDWNQERPFYYQDIKPFNQNDWPNPLAFKSPPKFHIHSRKIDEPAVQDPFVPVIFNNPQTKRSSALSWIYLAPFQEIFTRPVGSTVEFPTPARLKSPIQDWIQSRPSFYTEPTAVLPIGKAIFPAAVLRKPYIIVTISTRFPQPAETGKPFTQNDWPNPKPEATLRPGWIDYFIIDQNLPRPTESTALPLRKRPFIPTWIYNSSTLVVSSGSIPPTFDYPNPVIVKRPTQTHLVNLLQSTLDPGVGERPFFQTEWPLPQKAKIIHPQGWIHEKRFYATEEPLQPAQYDWPVPRTVKRNHVGFIHFIRQEQDQPLPEFASVTDVPRSKGRQTITFASSALIDLTAVVGLKPFNQTQWPNPLRFRSSRDLLTWINQSPFIIPNIVGRIICLMMSEEEFFLEINESDYDLIMRADEYDLDMGGRDCE